MHSICYVSAASTHMSHDELVALLKVCQQKNSVIGVTGLLLYNGQGTFIQVLEGEQATLEKLYSKIKTDSRHHRVNCIGKKEIDKRSFPEWSMGFKSLANEDLSSIQGFSDFMTSSDSSEYLSTNKSFAYSLLSHFKNTSLDI